MDEVPITLDTICGGAALERFTDELDRVLENIADPNTEAEKQRSITLTITFKPNEDRDWSKVGLESKVKLAPLHDVGSQVFMGRNPKGEMVAVEHDPKQMNWLKESNLTPITGGKETDGK